jgi:pimeloyl-ACP methyl ester carboxylesterase
MSEPFSLAELVAAGTSNVEPLQTLSADDGIMLAYRAYVPAAPSAVLVFYHGGGAHSGAGYAHLAAGLRDRSIAVYTPDLRGHGASGGDRGDAPSAEQLWRDFRTLIDFAAAEHPELPVFAGGHSSGAGLTLNYASWPERTPVSGYVFLSPQLGHRSETARPAEPTRQGFVEVSVLPFVVNGVTGGWLMGHSRAVVFHYPPAALESDPGLVTWNTVNLANGITPQAPGDQFAALDRPFGLWIGANDEIFLPERVVAFGELANGVSDASTAAIVPDQNHLGILVRAAEQIGPWLEANVP